MTGGRSRVVERAFDQIAGRQQVLQALLVLDADRVAAEIVGDAHGGDVHLALQQDLVVGQVACAWFGPVSNVMPRSSIQCRTASASSSVTCVVS